jgi:hypothetical protein
MRWAVETLFVSEILFKGMNPTDMVFHTQEISYRNRGPAQRDPSGSSGSPK